MRIMSFMSPLAAICIASYGMYRSVSRYFRLSRRSGGMADVSAGCRGSIGFRPAYMYMYRLVDRRSFVERYYTEEVVYVPESLGVLCAGSIFGRVSSGYRALLDGFGVSVTDRYPFFAREPYIKPDGSIGGRVRAEFGVGEFCKRHGVTRRKVDRVLSEIKSGVYMEMCRLGHIREEDFR